MPESGGSWLKKLRTSAWNVDRRFESMISNTKHFRMHTYGKVVQGEQSCLEISGLPFGFKKGCRQAVYTPVHDVVPVLCLLRVSESETCNPTSVKWLKPGITALNRPPPKVARCYALWYSLKVVCAVAGHLWRAKICANGL